MINAVIRYALKHRLAILVLAIATFSYGSWTISRLPVDVFPDLNRPTVTILTESHGLAPEEVETLVTIPIESVMNGVPGVVRVRSNSGIGISIVVVEFEWATDIYRNRQLLTERLQLLQGQLPEGMQPTMAPITSLMGEIQFVGLTSPKTDVSPMELRTIADWVIRPRLLAISGISQVVVIGGEVKQYQILVSSQKLQYFGISLEELEHALSEISLNTTGGFIDIETQEYLIRPLGRVESLDEIENSFVAMHLGKPVFVKDIARVKFGAKIKRGDGSINAAPAVVMTIKKQPGTDTIKLSLHIDQELQDIQKTLPDGLIIRSDLFKQAHFIDRAIMNVEEALLHGAIMVALVLFLFLFNTRTTFITLCAIPLSFVITGIVFKFLGLSINTMTLGGLAIAIGEVVDDAIVNVENVFRRLRENSQSQQPKPVLRVIYAASSEVRNSIVFATLIVILVFIPLFALSGMEGRLFVPLGIAYIVSLLASLVISLTLSPVLCYYLLPHSKVIQQSKDSQLVQVIKKRAETLVRYAVRHPKLIMASCGFMLLAVLCVVPFMGQDFLPKFNEGTATIGVAATPGISLDASNELGNLAEKAILKIPEVKSTTRRTGRAEMDEHAEGVYWNEIDVDFHEEGRDRSIVLKELRQKIAATSSEITINIGQPISHRLDHLLSGIRAQIAIKLFGPDLSELRRLGGEIVDAIQPVPDLVDIQMEPLVLVPQLKIAIDRQAAGKSGIPTGKLAEELEAALNGRVVGQVLENQQYFELFMRFDEQSRADPSKIQQAIVRFLPNGVPVYVEDVASVYQGSGPNMINRENMLRRLAISANSEGRDLGRLVADIRAKIQEEVILPTGYFIKYGGQYASQRAASKRILFLGALSLLGIILVLYFHFRSVPLTLQIIANVPLALIGSIIAIFLTERVFSLATLIAFITLCGIASRNGIMMISHYIHLVQEEGEAFDLNMVIRGTLERLIPVFMTAFTAILALTPILFSKGEPGKEILYPVAVVIVGGLLSSTLLDILVTPTLFYRFGRKSVARIISQSTQEEEI